MQNCYNVGKVSRETQDGQNERLTNKHIKTLSFLQEMAKENKDLKARIQELEVINIIFHSVYVYCWTARLQFTTRVYSQLPTDLYGLRP